MRAEETVDFHIRWTWHKINKMYNNLGANKDLSTSIGFVLLNIDREGTPSTKLGPKMGMEPRSLTRTLKNLEEQGLVYRKIDPNDRRMVRIFLTEAGKEKRKQSKETVLGFNKLVYENLDQEKLDCFLEVMQVINENIEKYTANETED